MTGVRTTVLAIAGLLAAFGFLAAYAATGQTAPFERAALLLFRDPANPASMLGPRWLPEMLRDLTSLGSTIVLGLVVVALATALALARKRADTAFFLTATIGGQIASSGLKHIVGRARPDLVPGAPTVFTASFPSGHALLSAVTYLTIGALLSEIEPRRSLRVFYVGVAIALTTLVGFSRVALGVHWPTDVLAGWCIGGAWALFCGLIARYLRERRTLEPLA